ncbi:unnamed protein product [Allacma fusca]|uniref:Uncharacterized protein n=1 Tax=Allacma fusca TaxID=39272 RepID=A0A8J2PJG2_9HEXA|nr:unnamed protein product [Allacma fusca]
MKSFKSFHSRSSLVRVIGSQKFYIVGRVYQGNKWLANIEFLPKAEIRRQQIVSVSRHISTSTFSSLLPTFHTSGSSIAKDPIPSHFLPIAAIAAFYPGPEDNLRDKQLEASILTVDISISQVPTQPTTA